MKIALAFSGGGVRATVFHLGVLACLARQDWLKDVKIVSSVSGGSLAAGLVVAYSGNRWPDSEEYLNEIVPQIYSVLTTRNLQRQYAIRTLMFPWRLASGRAAVLGDELERQWDIGGKLADLPVSPRLIINATCYETGKNWRFRRDLMGDYQTRYVVDPDFKLSHALAASAAVPGLIGPLIVKAKNHDWHEYRNDDWSSIPPKYKRMHLWDGGVYDNLGIEPLFKPSEGLCKDADFLIVCDASRPLPKETRGSIWNPGFLRASLRLVDVATDQVRSLRARMLVDHFKQNPGTGVYLRLGSQSKRGTPSKRCTKSPSTIGALDLPGVDLPGEAVMTTNEEAIRASQIETTLRQLSHAEFNLLFRHGYQVASTNLSTRCQKVIKALPRNHMLYKAA